MPRVPLLSGPRIVALEVPEGSVALRPPAPGAAIEDVSAAVREALRYPLAGRPLAELATRGGSATLVIEPPSLPIPASDTDPRHEAVGAAVDELERLGVTNVTIVVAGGLERRATRVRSGCSSCPSSAAASAAAWSSTTPRPTT